MWKLRRAVPAGPAGEGARGRDRTTHSHRAIRSRSHPHSDLWGLGKHREALNQNQFLLSLWLIWFATSPSVDGGAVQTRPLRWKPGRRSGRDLDLLGDLVSSTERVLCAGDGVGPGDTSSGERGSPCENRKGNCGGGGPGGGAWSVYKEPCPVRGFAETPQVPVGPGAPLRGGGVRVPSVCLLRVSRERAGPGRPLRAFPGAQTLGHDATSRSTRTGPGASAL